jgi:succinate dehydrogenase (ubiquinone) cytochrome b560 subunit
MAMTPKYQVVMKVNQKTGVKSAQQQVDDWQDAAKTKGRPMSPHLGIYVWSIPMTMSALNRIFAFALTFGFLAIPLVDIYTGDFCASMTALSAMARESVLGTALLTGLKAGIFFPFFYHTFLGFRHWSWDIFALGIRDMGVFYQTGYIAIAASLVFTAACVLYHNSGSA